MCSGRALDQMFLLMGAWMHSLLRGCSRLFFSCLATALSSTEESFSKGGDALCRWPAQSWKLWSNKIDSSADRMYLISHCSHITSANPCTSRCSNEQIIQTLWRSYIVVLLIVRRRKFRTFYCIHLDTCRCGMCGVCVTIYWCGCEPGVVNSLLIHTEEFYDENPHPRNWQVIGWPLMHNMANLFVLITCIWVVVGWSS